MEITIPKKGLRFSYWTEQNYEVGIIVSHHKHIKTSDKMIKKKEKCKQSCIHFDIGITPAESENP